MKVLVVTCKRLLPVHFLSAVLDTFNIPYTKQSAKMANGYTLYGLTCKEKIDRVQTLAEMLDEPDMRIREFSIDVI